MLSEILSNVIRDDGLPVCWSRLPAPLKLQRRSIESMRDTGSDKNRNSIDSSDANLVPISIGDSSDYWRFPITLLGRKDSKSRIPHCIIANFAESHFQNLNTVKRRHRPGTFYSLVAPATRHR